MPDLRDEQRVLAHLDVVGHVHEVVELRSRGRCAWPRSGRGPRCVLAPISTSSPISDRPALGHLLPAASAVRLVAEAVRAPSTVLAAWTTAARSQGLDAGVEHDVRVDRARLPSPMVHRPRHRRPRPRGAPQPAPTRQAGALGRRCNPARRARPPPAPRRGVEPRLVGWTPGLHVGGGSGCEGADRPGRDGSGWGPRSAGRARSTPGHRHVVAQDHGPGPGALEFRAVLGVAQEADLIGAGVAQGRRSHQLDRAVALEGGATDLGDLGRGSRFHALSPSLGPPWPSYGADWPSLGWDGIALASTPNPGGAVKHAAPPEPPGSRSTRRLRRPPAIVAPQDPGARRGHGRRSPPRGRARSRC